MDSEDEETVLDKEKFETSINNSENINTSDLPVSEMEEIDDIESKEEVQIISQENINFIDKLDNVTEQQNELEQQDEKTEKELINEIPEPEQEEVLNQSASEDTKRNDNQASKNKTNKRKTVKTIDDIFNLYGSIMPPEEAKKIPFKEFFYDHIAKEYSNHDFIGYNFNLRYKEGKLFKIYKNGKEERYEYSTLEQHYSKYCNLTQL